MVPNNPTLHTRKLGTVTYAAGQRNSLELDKDGVLYGLRLHLTYTVTNGGTSPAGLKFQTLARLLSRVEVIAGGRDTIQSVPGWLLTARAYNERGILPYGMDATVVTTGSAATTYELVIPVDFTMPLGRRMDDTGLDTMGLNQLAVHVTWGDAESLFTTTNSAAVSAVSLEVSGIYMVNPSRDKPYMVRTLDWQSVDVSADNTDFGITLDNRTGLLISSLMMVATDADAGSDSVINSVELKAGAHIFSQEDATIIKAKNRDLVKGTPLTGVYFLDPKWDGQLANGIDTRPAAMPSDLKAVLDVTKGSGTTKIHVQREGVRALLV